MAEPISDLGKLLFQPQRNRLSFKPEPANSSGIDSEDTSVFTGDQLLSAVRTQANDLKKELPPLISQALLAPANDSSIRSEPLNALLFKLENPLDSLIGRIEEEGLTEELFSNLQSEVRQLRSQIPGFTDSSLLSGFSSDAQFAGPLQDILTALTDRLDGLDTRIGQAADKRFL